MTEEVNAAVAGALKAGATEVLVNDAHFTMTNILVEDFMRARRSFPVATNSSARSKGWTTHMRGSSSSATTKVTARATA